MWMNEYEVESAIRLFDDPDTPNLYAAAESLAQLVEWTNSNSDGWPYWPKPAKAATRLMDLLQMAQRQAYNGTLRDASAADLTTALRPVKAFLTRQGVDSATVLTSARKARS